MLPVTQHELMVQFWVFMIPMNVDVQIWLLTELTVPLILQVSSCMSTSRIPGVPITDTFNL